VPLDCLRLARQVYGNQYPGKAIYQSGIRIIHATVSGDLGDALELAYVLATSSSKNLISRSEIVFSYFSI
jgi:hypothetical protein